MKALTLKHPWPWAIAVLGKRIENRTWWPHSSQLKLGDWFAIHGGVLPKSGSDVESIAAQALFLASKFPEKIDPDRSTVRHAILTGIVAVARFGGVVESSDSFWFEGPFGWVLEEVVVLPEPIPCKGAQGLWDVPDDVRQAIRQGFRMVNAQEATHAES